jgi:hypothetical protein
MFQKKLLYYKCRNCDTNLTANTPANRYQIQKLIQNTVRVPASEYVMNKASLNVVPNGKDVCWNQQSDRSVPSIQKATIPTGMFNSMNGKHTSHTSSRPGCQTPGGVGCDIKHNSYDRYLNRLKGKKILKRGIIPPEFALPTIPFNRAYPVYGGKLVKTAIVSGYKCACPSKIDDNIIYQTNENAIKYSMSSFTPESYCSLKERKQKELCELNEVVNFDLNTLNKYYLPNIY